MMQIYSLVKQTPDNEAIAYPVMNLLFSIASDLSRHAARQQEGAIVSETAELTRFLLNESLTQKISLEDISAKLYKSKSQINREFVKYFGTTPYKYLLDRRLELAKFMLANTNTSVKEISDTLVFVDEDGAETVAHGTVEGKLGREERGSGGFGYDPLFYPDAFAGKRTLAEVSQTEKNAVSHRGNALRQLRALLAGS